MYMNKFTEVMYILNEKRLPSVQQLNDSLQSVFSTIIWRKKSCHMRFWNFQEWKKEPFKNT